MVERWYGMSLSLVRQVTQQLARFANCKQAIDHTEVATTNRYDPPVGAFVWFDNDPYGDVGLSLGEGLMLAVNADGAPIIARVDGWHHATCGWSRTIGPDDG